jgi:hypothetical protein
MGEGGRRENKSQSEIQGGSYGEIRRRGMGDEAIIGV